MQASCIFVSGLLKLACMRESRYSTCREYRSRGTRVTVYEFVAQPSLLTKSHRLWPIRSKQVLAAQPGARLDVVYPSQYRTGDSNCGLYTVQRYAGTNTPFNPPRLRFNNKRPVCIITPLPKNTSKYTNPHQKQKRFQTNKANRRARVGGEATKKRDIRRDRYKQYKAYPPEGRGKRDFM